LLGGAGWRSNSAAEAARCPGWRRKGLTGEFWTSIVKKSSIGLDIGGAARIKEYRTNGIFYLFLPLPLCNAGALFWRRGRRVRRPWGGRGGGLQGPRAAVQEQLLGGRRRGRLLVRGRILLPIAWRAGNLFHV